MTPYVRGLAAAGITARAVQLPRGTAERALPAYRAAAPLGPGTVVGGQSFGGRVASLLAAEGEVGGLVLICYPLHPPGAPDRWDQRTEHWPRIACPVLLLSGDRDPFARIACCARRSVACRTPSCTSTRASATACARSWTMRSRRIAAFVRGLD